MSQRANNFFTIFFTLIPIASILIAISFFIFDPLFVKMEYIIDLGFNKIKPIRNLQRDLLDAVMPPNDYLIYADHKERENWIYFKNKVAKSFSEAERNNFSAGTRKIINNVRREWEDASDIGDTLFRYNNEEQSRAEAYAVMERFDVKVVSITNQLEKIASIIEEEAHSQYVHIGILKRKALIFTFAAIFMGLAVGVVGSILMTRSSKKMHKLSTHDPLTGILNRRGLDNVLSRLVKHQITREGPVFALLLIDIDRFKSVNDNFGHDVGDMALLHMADQVREAIRKDDIFGRYGGEEFLVILPETDIYQAIELAERIRMKMESSPFELPDDTGVIKMTLSIGCTACKDASANIRILLKQADSAMYRAKETGRNRVVSSLDLS